MIKEFRERMPSWLCGLFIYTATFSVPQVQLVVVYSPLVKEKKIWSEELTCKFLSVHVDWKICPLWSGFSEMKKNLKKNCTTRWCESGLKTIAMPLKCLGISKPSLAYNIARTWDILLITRIFPRLREAWKSTTHFVTYPCVLSSNILN